MASGSEGSDWSWFTYPWTKGELTILRDAIVDMMWAFDLASFSWNDTPLTNTRFGKVASGSSSSWPGNYISLREVDEQTIWHESAHRLDFAKGRLLSRYYDCLAGVCEDVTFCTDETPNGYYYRDYGWNPRQEYGLIYMAAFGRMEAFADAFAAWVYVTTGNGSYPVLWEEGRAKDPGQPEQHPQWESIVTNAAQAVALGYGYGR